MENNNCEALNSEIGSCSNGHKPLSIQEWIESMKNNKFCPPLSEITFTDISTGNTYTAEDLDKLLNN